MQTYSISTAERTYNSVQGKNILEAKAQFQAIRENWNDASKVKEAYRWNPETGQWDEIKAALRW